MQGFALSTKDSVKNTVDKSPCPCGRWRVVIMSSFPVLSLPIWLLPLPSLQTVLTKVTKDFLVNLIEMCLLLILLDETFATFEMMITFSQNPGPMDFPVGPAVGTPRFHCKGCRFDPWWEN